MPCSPPQPPDPCILPVRVQPNASRSEIAGWTEDGYLKVRIQAPAVDGKANKALIAFLAQLAGVSKSRVSIQRGQHSRQKVIAFAALSHSEWQRLPRP